MKKYYLILSLFLASQCLWAQESSLTIKVSGIEELKGIIQVGIYNKEEAFPKIDSQYRIEYFDVDSKEMILKMDGLAHGEYAIALFHDVNGDGICNLNMLSIPKEPYGFSNNIKPVFSSPSFESTKFILNANKNIQIELLD